MYRSGAISTIMTELPSEIAWPSPDSEETKVVAVEITR